MKRSLLRLAAVLLASAFVMSLAATAASAAMAGPGAPSFSAVMRHTPKTLFPVPGTAILTVTDAETGLPVPGARYDLFRASLYGGTDTKIGSYVTDEDGCITVGHVTTGTLYWAAASAVEGYAADTEKHAFTIRAAQFTATGIALAKPAPEPEPADDGYVPLDLEKVLALARFVMENGVYNDSGNPYYMLSSFYPAGDGLDVRTDIVVYVEDGEPFSVAIGHILGNSADDSFVTMSILTLSSSPVKTMYYWDQEDTEYTMKVDGSKFAYTLDPTTFVYSVYYEDLQAYLEDGSEADLDTTTIMLVELKKLLRDFNASMEFWGQDVNADDIGFPFHNFEGRFTLVLGEGADEIVPVESDNPLFEVFGEFFGE